MAGSKLSELAYWLYIASIITPSFASAPPPPAKTQSLYGQCGGRGYFGLTACPTNAYCSTQNAYYAQCTNYRSYSTTITSGNSLFTTAITTTGAITYEVIDPEGTTTITTTIPATATPFTTTIQAKSFSSGTVIIGTPSPKPTSSTSSTKPLSSASSSASTVKPLSSASSSAVVSSGVKASSSSTSATPSTASVTSTTTTHVATSTTTTLQSTPSSSSSSLSTVAPSSSASASSIQSSSTSSSTIASSSSSSAQAILASIIASSSSSTDADTQSTLALSIPSAISSTSAIASSSAITSSSAIISSASTDSASISSVAATDSGISSTDSSVPTSTASQTVSASDAAVVASTTFSSVVASSTVGSVAQNSTLTDDDDLSSPDNSTTVATYNNATSLNATSSSIQPSSTQFQLYTASVCPPASTSATPAPTAAPNATCASSSTEVNPQQQLAGSPFHILPDPDYCAQICLNTASCESFAVNTIAGSLTSDCYLYNSTTASQDYSGLNSTTGVQGNVTYYDASCYDCADSSAPSFASTCGANGGFVFIPCLQSLYGFPLSFQSVDSVSFGILEIGSATYEQNSMDDFSAMFGRGFIPAGYGPVLDSIDGGVATNDGSANEGVEADVDLQYGIGITFPQNVTLYQDGNAAVAGSFNTFLDALDSSYCGSDLSAFDPSFPSSNSAGYQGSEMCGTYGTTQVISSSYAWSEAQFSSEPDPSDPSAHWIESFYYLDRQCMEYMKLGLMGSTLLFASGDHGAAGNDGWCAAYDPAVDYDDFYYYLEDQGGYFSPLFPATCPYVTAVGATQLGEGATLPEVAGQWTGESGEAVGSSGGFSNVFPMPSYQADAVGAYWDNGYAPNYGNGPWTNSNQDGYPIYNTSQTTRGIPDISANGVSWLVFEDGNGLGVYGTSLSTPLYGTLFTMINQQRALIGKGPVGFVNPVLYANTDAFTDITEGCGGGCGTDGFCAEPGWDPVTGLGTPKYEQLLAIYLALP